MPFAGTLFLGLYCNVFQIIGFDFAYFPGDLGDGRLNLFFLEHAHMFFTGKIHSFWNAGFMYPEPLVISYSDNLLGSAPIYSMYRLFGFETFTAYQLWFITLAVLNYSAAYLLLKKIYNNPLAAALGAFVFAFSMSLHSQLTHAQTFPRFAIPLAMLMLINFSQKLDTRFFFFTLLFIVYQFYCAVYLGFLLAVPIGIFFLFIIISKYNVVKKLVYVKMWTVKMSASLLFNILLLIPLFLPYLKRNVKPSLQHFYEILDTIPTPLSYFSSFSGSMFWKWLSNRAMHYPAWWDHQLFTGGIATICVIVSCIFLLRKISKTKWSELLHSKLFLLAATGVLTTLLFMRFSNVSLYILLYYMPGYSSMRSLTRIINIELLFFAIAIAFVFSKVLPKIRWKSYLFFIIFAILLLFDNIVDDDSIYRTSKHVAIERSAWLEKIFASFPPNALVSYEPNEIQSLPIYYHIDAMLASQQARQTTVNGYTATCPSDFSDFWNRLDAYSRNYWLIDKQLLFDTLYVVNSENEHKKVLLSEELYEMSLEIDKKIKEMQNLINYIRSDKEWMIEIEKKALEKNIPVDSVLYIDAKWILEKNDK
jgi:hypothetical protein